MVRHASATNFCSGVKRALPTSFLFGFSIWYGFTGLVNFQDIRLFLYNIGYFFDDLQKILKKKAARNKKARAARRLARWRAKRYAFLYAIWPYEDLQAALADGWYKHKPVASNYYHALITQIHKEDPSSRYFLQAEDFLRIREVLHNISLYPGYYSALPGHTDIGGWVAHLRVRNRDHPGPDRVDWELNFVYKNLYLLFRLWRSKNISNYQKFIDFFGDFNWDNSIVSGLVY